MKKRHTGFIVFASICFFLILGGAINAENYALWLRLYLIFVAVLPIILYFIITAIERSDEKRARGIVYSKREIERLRAEADFQLSEARKNASTIIQRAQKEANEITNAANQECETIANKKTGLEAEINSMTKELGDASVPFEFDVHAVIFSEDAPALETILHNTFKENQVNLVNPRKEFYNVSLNEIEKVVKENYNATVTFTQIAEAAQYRESVKLRNAVCNV